MRCARHFLNFSWLTQKADSLTKFIAERQDTENMRTFRLASRTKIRTLEKGLLVGKKESKKKSKKARREKRR
jgi:hypothetical protein